MNDEKRADGTAVLSSAELGVSEPERDAVCMVHVPPHWLRHLTSAWEWTTKMRRGCGTYFPPGTTAEQAKKMI